MKKGFNPKFTMQYILVFLSLLLIASVSFNIYYATKKAHAKWIDPKGIDNIVLETDIYASGNPNSPNRNINETFSMYGSKADAKLTADQFFIHGHEGKPNTFTYKKYGAMGYMITGVKLADGTTLSQNKSSYGQLGNRKQDGSWSEFGAGISGILMGYNGHEIALCWKK